MGLPMARNLLAADYPLRVWNRTASKAQPLLDAGALLADTPGLAVEGAEFVIVMVSDEHTADAVLFAGDGCAIAKIPPSACVIVASTMPPQVAKRQAEKCRENNIAYLDAPVSGGEAGARRGDLAIMVGGDVAAYARAEPVLKTLGTPQRIGESGCGQLAKLANQAIVGATIAAVSEALLLARAGGADTAAVREALLGGFADSTVLRQHGERMVKGDFTPGGAAKYQLRDLKNALREAENYGVETPMMTSAAVMFGQMIAAGFSEADHSALYQFWKERGETTYSGGTK